MTIDIQRLRELLAAATPGESVDPALIVAAVNALPQLLGEVEESRARIGGYAARVKQAEQVIGGACPSFAKLVEVYCAACEYVDDDTVPGFGCDELIAAVDAARKERT